MTEKQKMQSGFLRKPDCIFVWFIDGDTIMNYNIRDVRNNPTQYSHIGGGLYHTGEKENANERVGTK